METYNGAVTGAQIDEAVKKVLDGKFAEQETANGTASALSGHVQDNGKHITAAERTAWDGKQDALTGQPWQAVGFGADGTPVAVQRWSNRNLLDNAYFADPINQRGQTAYTAPGYTIDRWFIDSGMELELKDEGISFDTSATSWRSFAQKIEPSFIKPLNGKVVTFSVLAKISPSDSLRILLFSYNNFHEVEMNKAGNGEWDVYSITTTLSSEFDLNSLGALIGGNMTHNSIIKAAKFEPGSTQTLAHKEGGSWVLNDPPPDKALELLKCLPYQVETVGNFIPPFNDIVVGTISNGIAEFTIPLPTVMRAIPALICDLSQVQIANVAAGSYSAPTNGEVVRISNREVCIRFTSETASDGGKAWLRVNNTKIILDANL